MRFLSRYFDGFFRIEPVDLAEPRDLTLAEKLARERHDRYVADKSLHRQSECWTHACRRRACYWVREVSFDLKGEKAAPVQHSVVSSADYPGPVPGFCAFCADGPRELAEAVYWDRPEFGLGLQPSRWWVTMTDGLIYGGEVTSFVPRGLPIVSDHLT